MKAKPLMTVGKWAVCPINGEVLSVVGDAIILRGDDGNELTIRLRKYNRSNRIHLR
jgi:hypothetical protein